LFEIDPPHIAAATMVALARAGSVSTDRAAEAIKTLDVDPEKVDPLSL
jgi:pyruvate dehydrogenase complex dehydrogenase (E1) component